MNSIKNDLTIRERLFIVLGYDPLLVNHKQIILELLNKVEGK